MKFKVSTTVISDLCAELFRSARDGQMPQTVTFTQEEGKPVRYHFECTCGDMSKKGVIHCTFKQCYLPRETV